MNDTPLWKPSKRRIEAANLTAFMRLSAQRWGAELADYAALHRWSVTQPEPFWTTLWDASCVIGERGERVLVDANRMPGAKWFPDARLNFAENLLRGDRSAADALVFWGEDKVRGRVSRAELYRAVAQTAAA